MTEQEHTGENHEQDSDFRQFTLETAPFDSLQLGDVIAGLDSKADMQRFEDRIAEVFCDNEWPAPFQVTRSKSAPDSLATELRPRRFAGRLKDGYAVVLPDTHYEYWPSADPSKREQPTLRMWVQADMHSTGRGKIGESGLYARYTQTVGRQGGIRSGVHREIKKAASRVQSERLLNSLNWESSAIHHTVAEIALRNTILAGLPTLGKR